MLCYSLGGVNVLDPAPVYGKGKSAEIGGQT